MRPVGFFDSGLGGASVLREALHLLPNENYLYYGDDANAPYGDRSYTDIAFLTEKSVSVMADFGIKAAVIACNTATATCVDALRGAFPFPIVSIEPAIKPACETEGSGRVLMLSTAATASLPRYKHLLSTMKDPSRVVSVPCPGLVERIERGCFAADAFDDILEKHLSFLEGETIDAIVMGCTHYVFIKKAFARYASLHFRGKAELFDGNAATVRQLGRVLKANNIENPCGSAHVEYRTSGDKARLDPIFRSLIAR